MTRVGNRSLGGPPEPVKQDAVEIEDCPPELSSDHTAGAEVCPRSSDLAWFPGFQPTKARPPKITVIV